MRRSATEPQEAPRVLVIPSSYFARDRTVGGGERYAFEYARALSRLTPTTLALFDVEPGSETVDGLEVRTFRVRRLDARDAFPFTRETRAALGGFDVVHPMIFPTPLTDQAVVQARLRGQTVVLTDVGGGSPCLSTYLQRLHPRADLNRLAHGLALLSRHSAAQFAGWRQPKTILYGGAEVPRERGEPGGYALFVGRLLPHKGVLPLVEALSPDTPLRVVGRPYDPEYFRRLRDAARGKDVTFVTDAGDGELRRQYLGASVVLQPSIPVNTGASDTSELLGLVTLEGMAHGKPVVVTRTASLPELVREGETGFVVPPGDGAALRARVERLVRDPGASRAMGAAARRHVLENFTWDQVAGRGLRLYRALRGEAAVRAAG
ncbi:MAG TPA: glycosyltransferase family 4 protein [Longimicrobiaceae bacterium]|nr:glycosyltransferase family 4 protein [Longimicrobiaceae bacterium]